MHAILIKSENLPVIKGRIFVLTYELFDLELFLRSKTNWYLVSGFYGDHGPIVDWTVLPEYIINQRFDFNPETIKVDWAQIVRKEEPK